METDDQNGQDPDDEILHKMHTEEITESIATQVLSMRTEESILQEATKEIEDITKANFQSEEGIKRLIAIENNETSTKNCIGQVELQKQVQTGEITPFEAVTKHSSSQRIKGTFDKTSHLLDLEKYLKQQAELANQKKRLKSNTKTLNNEETVLIPTKKTKLSSCSSNTYKKSDKAKAKAGKKKSASNLEKMKHGNVDYDDCTTENTKSDQVNELTNDNKNLRSISTFVNTSKDNTGDNLITSSNNEESMNLSNDSESEYVPSDEQIDSEDEIKVSSKKRKTSTKLACTRTKRILDDGNELMYRQRVEESKLGKTEPVHKIDNLFKIPQSIWKRLYKYQKVSVQWLWELHGRNLGGLLGDEMGLGKTVQVIAFLAGLDCSELLSDGGRFRGLGPTIVVCPATLMEQWVKHFHEWWPILRIVVLHQSGTYSGDLEYLINSLKAGGILITSYSGMLRHKDLLISTQWHYIILDEGHKIRNPQAKVSKAVKEFSTPHRLLLTGSPMQNSLKELWSLFDFILPGKLGTLPAFLEHCASPITRGGYANATPLQEATALHVATMLKDAITPYMLRRTKNDVQHHVSLPEKNEQVLFCSLTEEQKNLYKSYLRSDDVSFILHEKNNHHESGRYRARLLISLSALRKICNHPDLYLYTSQIDSDEETDMSEECLKKFGHWKRAGKMTVVRSLLKIWKRQGHRALLFTQGRQMMHILESLVQSEKYTYLRMDGTTPMSQRQETIRLFNNNPTYFVFLLTTRVGGLGVNLTGANRVVIYDPDWNPATDAQARERAWRIGQNKNVTIYRLITAGTIEEKIYHRQIFKVLLSNKVLEDPRQRRLFKTSDLAELFNLNEPIDGKSSESDRLFRDSKLSVTTQFSSSKIEKMRKLAATLSKTISQNVSNTAPSTQSACNSDKTTICNHINNEDSKDLTAKETRTLEHNNKHSNFISSKETIKNKSIEEKTEKEQLTLDRNENIFSSETQKNDGGGVLINNDMRDNIEISLSNEVSDANNVPTNEGTIQSNTFNGLEDINNATDIMPAKNESTVCDPCNTRRKHKKSKKNSRLEKKISAIFEGEHVSCLIGRRLGTSQPDEPNPAEDDHYVLKKLFAKATVSSAFQHEAVLSNRGYNPDDKNPMQRLARETALESMDSVRKSRKWCWKPTWDSASLKNDDL